MKPPRLKQPFGTIKWGLFTKAKHIFIFIFIFAQRISSSFSNITRAKVFSHHFSHWVELFRHTLRR
jgi:hypothetical protein